MTNVKGKWALVTGASRGLGKLSALLLADYGCNLILHSRDKSHCENFAKELETKGVKTFCVQAELDKLADSRLQMHLKARCQVLCLEFLLTIKSPEEFSAPRNMPEKDWKIFCRIAVFFYLRPLVDLTGGFFHIRIFLCRSE